MLNVYDLKAGNEKGRVCVFLIHLYTLDANMKIKMMTVVSVTNMKIKMITDARVATEIIDRSRSDIGRFTAPLKTGIPRAVYKISFSAVCKSAVKSK